jgi:hypothetical protein
VVLHSKENGMKETKPGWRSTEHGLAGIISASAFYLIQNSPEMSTGQGLGLFGMCLLGGMYAISRARAKS